MHHPFADHMKLQMLRQEHGYSKCQIEVEADLHHNPHAVVHGAVLYALADTGMGAALYPTLEEGQSCATIEIKMNYFRPVLAGTVVCETTLLNRGRSVANLDARLLCDNQLVAQANGNYAIIRR
ncbi:PaaI family thioesterase [Haliea sp. E1-2-M8]|uniref:PaaI family thioesterase n=1 Tax=Haliea sp. E1-2-M8 TaxID=3064706 RepID=UPI00272408DE|nr:PaaI family thioesterase [Haliea sp. E1-2-M8]MDO8860570.1 PaaI family thioesterase [Haliea sp. E1-2-M8]